MTTISYQATRLILEETRRNIATRLAGSTQLVGLDGNISVHHGD